MSPLDRSSPAASPAANASKAAVAQRPMRREDEDFARFASTFTANGWPRPVEAVRWQYRDNPAERVWVEFAEAAVATAPTDSPLAAIYATLPVRVRIRRRDGRDSSSNVHLAMQSIDTLTDREFRGRGLFLQLARTVFDRAAREGAAFVFGFPNGNSAPGFFGKLGWSRLDPLPFLVRPLRTRYLAERLPKARFGGLAQAIPDLPLHPSTRRNPRRVPLAIDRFDERFTTLWTSFAQTIGVAVERDARYLNWRLVDKPGESYRRLAFFENGQPTSFVAFALKEKHGGRIGYIMELLSMPGKSGDARELLSLALAELTREGADVAIAWSLPHSPSFTSYLRAGFVPLPEKLRPIELHFGACAFDPELADIVGRRASWYLSYLDSDTV